MSIFSKLSIFILLFLVSCGTQETQVYSTYTNREFGFVVTIPDDLVRAGWGIVNAEDATVFHVFTPPDTSTWEAIAVVVPPGALFPSLSPFFIDVFNVKDPTLSSVALADKKAARVGDRVLSRKILTADGRQLAQLVHGAGDDVNYETYVVGNGFGYAFLAQGAPDTSQTAVSFRVDSDAYDRIIVSLKLTTPR